MDEELKEYLTLVKDALYNSMPMGGTQGSMRRHSDALYATMKRLHEMENHVTPNPTR